MQIARSSMVHPGTQGNHHIRDVSLRPISQRPSSICGCAATDLLLTFPLRLPHPVASHARVRMMLQSIANSLPTPPPLPPGSSPPALTQFEDIPRQVWVGCDNIRKTVLLSPPVL